MEPSDVTPLFAGPDAFQFDCTRMVPVTLFQVDGAYGVLPSEELDDSELAVDHEFDPYEMGPAH